MLDIRYIIDTSITLITILFLIIPMKMSFHFIGSRRQHANSFAPSTSICGVKHLEGQRCASSSALRFKRAILITWIVMLVLGAAKSTRAQTPITNGALTTATLAVGTTNRYTFTATNGESLLFRMGAPFRPLIVLYAPNGARLQTASGSGSSSLDAYLGVTAATNGVFRVEASSYYGKGKGEYSLTFAKAPGEFTVSPGDQGGLVLNGAASPGEITLGDMDIWNFDANKGDTVVVRMGAPAFRPLVYIYAPQGNLVATADGSGNTSNDADVSFRATTNGTFTVVVHSYYPNNKGPYTLHLAKASGAFVVSPGDQGGPLVSGATTAADLTLGDLDVWSFQANAGQNVQLRMGAPGYRPLLQIYGPSGDLLATDAGNRSPDRDAKISFKVPAAGLFTVIAQSYTLDSTGPYTLSFFKAGSDFIVSPGDEGGALQNGAAQPANLLLGDIDLWSFDASAGEAIALRVGAPGFRPEMSLYGPGGVLISAADGATSADRDVDLFLRATNAGRFTVLVQSYYPNGAGPYTLHFAQFPGTAVVSPEDEGGFLTTDVARDGVITLGDQDLWQFPVCVGETITLSCQKLSGTPFSPRIRLFGRSGELVGTASHATVAVIQLAAAASGIYSALVDAGALNQAGTYRLSGTGISEGLSLCLPSVNLSGTVLAGVGGEPGADFVLFSHSILTDPLASWTPILTNTFDRFGVFGVTNAFRTDQPFHYFRLHQQ